MDLGQTKNLENEAINEFFADSNIRMNHKKKQQRNRYPRALDSLDSVDMSSIHDKSIEIAQSFDGISSDQSLRQHVPKSKPQGLRPLATNDHHRVSDLMHRVSAVSGYTPDAASVSTNPSSNTEIAASMSEYQLKAMKDSSMMRHIMDRVIALHHELQNIIQANLLHRVELGKQVEDVNNRYIAYFEEALGEMLRTQKQKFKSQTREIEALKEEIERLNDQINANQATIGLQGEKILATRQQLVEEKERYELSKLKAMNLQETIDGMKQKSSEADDAFALFKVKKQSEMDALVRKLRLESERTLNAEQVKAAEERNKLAGKLEKSQEVVENLKKEVEALKEKTKIVDNIDSSLRMRRPLRDNSCQTEVLDDGLWDKQDGWIMPISRTQLVRLRWRRSMKFAGCPSCRGIGNYVHRVGAILRNIKRGVQLVKEVIMEQDHSRWSLPDECVRFMSNLPKSAQAFRPRTLNWTVRCVYYLFALKSNVDRQDDALNYRRQSLVDFVIERYLMSTDSRPEAELRFYLLVKSVREHYRKHALLELFARFLGVLDQISQEEQLAIQADQSIGEEALKRKRHADLKELRARDRVKHIHGVKEKKKLEAKQAAIISKMHDFPFTQKALNLDILSITSLIRSCLLRAPYNGVFAVPMARIKATSGVGRMQQARSFQLRGASMENAFSVDAILPSVYHVDHVHSPSMKMKFSVAAVEIGGVRKRGPLSSSSSSHLHHHSSSSHHHHHHHSSSNNSATTNIIASVLEKSKRESGDDEATIDPVPLHLCFGESCGHYVPLDRVVYVLKPLLEKYLNVDQMTAVYHTLELNACFLMDNGSVELPEGMHSLIRSTMRMFSTTPIDGAYDLSWHDLYHSYVESKNHSEYAMYFVQDALDAAARTSVNSSLSDASQVPTHSTAHPPAKAIDVPIVGSLPSSSSPLSDSHASCAADDSDDDDLASGVGVNKSKSNEASEKELRFDDEEEEEEEEEESFEKVVIRRMTYTQDSKLTYLDVARIAQASRHNARTVFSSWHGTSSSSTSTGSDGAVWHDSNSHKSRGHKQKQGPTVGRQEDYLGNHPHSQHYESLHPQCIVVNLDVALKLVAETLLIRTIAVGQQLKQIFRDGDLNNDGVLSFAEFLLIVNKVAPDFHERKILKMFREALMKGDDDEHIGPEAFLEVCKEYDLVKILDLQELVEGALRGMCDQPPPQQQQQDGSSSSHSSFKADASLDVVVPKADNVEVLLAPVAEEGNQEEEEGGTALNESPPLQPPQSKAAVSTVEKKQRASPTKAPAAARKHPPYKQTNNRSNKNSHHHDDMLRSVDSATQTMDETETQAPAAAAVVAEAPDPIVVEADLSALRIAGMGNVVVVEGSKRSSANSSSQKASTSLHQHQHHRGNALHKPHASAEPFYPSVPEEGLAGASVEFVSSSSDPAHKSSRSGRAAAIAGAGAGTGTSSSSAAVIAAAGRGGGGSKLVGSDRSNNSSTTKPHQQKQKQQQQLLPARKRQLERELQKQSQLQLSMSHCSETAAAVMIPNHGRKGAGVEEVANHEGTSVAEDYKDDYDDVLDETVVDDHGGGRGRGGGGSSMRNIYSYESDTVTGGAKGYEEIDEEEELLEIHRLQQQKDRKVHQSGQEELEVRYEEEEEQVIREEDYSQQPKPKMNENGSTNANKYEEQQANRLRNSVSNSALTLQQASAEILDMMSSPPSSPDQRQRQQQKYTLKKEESSQIRRKIETSKSAVELHVTLPNRAQQQAPRHQRQQQQQHQPLRHAYQEESDGDSSYGEDYEEDDEEEEENEEENRSRRHLGGGGGGALPGVSVPAPNAEALAKKAQEVRTLRVNQQASRQHAQSLLAQLKVKRQMRSSSGGGGSSSSGSGGGGIGIRLRK